MTVTLEKYFKKISGPIATPGTSHSSSGAAQASTPPPIAEPEVPSVSPGACTFTLTPPIPDPIGASSGRGRSRPSRARPRGPVSAVAPSSTAGREVLSTPAVLRQISEFTSVRGLFRVGKFLSPLLRDFAILSLSEIASEEYIKNENTRNLFPPPNRLKLNWVSPKTQSQLTVLRSFREVKIRLTMEMARKISEEFPNVKQIQVIKEEVPDTKFLCFFGKVQSLEFLNCGYVDFPGIASCAELEYLAFQAKVKYPDARSPLQSLRKLRVLNISHSDGLYDLTIFGKMPKLESIIANDCKYEVMETDNFRRVAPP